MIRHPQPWYPKDPMEKKDKQHKDYWIGTQPSEVQILDQRGNKNPMNIQVKEKILDVLKLSPGHQGKSPPMTEHRIAEISLRDIVRQKDIF